MGILDIISAIILVIPPFAFISTIFMWYFYSKLRGWIALWWAVVTTLGFIASVPLGIAVYRRFVDLPRLEEMNVILGISVLISEILPIIIAGVTAYYYFISPRRGKRRKRRVNDDK